jgi:hypothetical protein
MLALEEIVRWMPLTLVEGHLVQAPLHAGISGPPWYDVDLTWGFHTLEPALPTHTKNELQKSALRLEPTVENYARKRVSSIPEWVPDHVPARIREIDFPERGTHYHLTVDDERTGLQRELHLIRHPFARKGQAMRELDWSVYTQWVEVLAPLCPPKNTEAILCPVCAGLTWIRDTVTGVVAMSRENEGEDLFLGMRGEDGQSRHLEVWGHSASGRPCRWCAGSTSLVINGGVVRRIDVIFGKTPYEVDAKTRAQGAE